jgi:transglutaminase-like putative cysteine protease
VRRFVRPEGTNGTRELLATLTHAVRQSFDYVPRTERGVQEPTRTLRLGSGTCRDFAVFMIEALRSLGLAARFVSGYIYVPQKSGSLGGGATHAWLRVYVPGAGWVELDPTNGIIGNRDLIRVGIARDHRHVLPLHGTWSGGPGDSLGMTVEVDVTASGPSA